MENKTSKRGYRVSFIIINIFVSFFVSVGAAAAIIHFYTPSKLVLAIIVIGIFLAWIILSVIFAERIWSDKNETVPILISREAVAKYRGVVYLFIGVIVLSVALIPLGKYGIVSDSFVTVAVNVLLWVGLIGLCSTMFYFSGSKGISANEILTYPFQFIGDPNEKAAVVHKKIKWNWIHSGIAALLVLLYYVIFQRDTLTFISLFVVLLGGAIYRLAQLKSLL